MRCKKTAIQHGSPAGHMSGKKKTIAKAHEIGKSWNERHLGSIGTREYTYRQVIKSPRSHFFSTQNQIQFTRRRLMAEHRHSTHRKGVLTKRGRAGRIRTFSRTLSPAPSLTEPQNSIKRHTRNQLHACHGRRRNIASRKGNKNSNTASVQPLTSQRHHIDIIL